MVRSFDHLTIVVRDLAPARAFFAVLGFREAMSVIITGEVFARYMSVPGIEAEHITLVLENASPRAEIQLLRYLHPEALRRRSRKSGRQVLRRATKLWTSIRASWFSSTDRRA